MAEIPVAIARLIDKPPSVEKLFYGRPYIAKNEFYYMDVPNNPMGTIAVELFSGPRMSAVWTQVDAIWYPGNLKLPIEDTFTHGYYHNKLFIFTKPVDHERFPLEPLTKTYEETVGSLTL